MAWKETLSEINTLAFLDERSLIKSFTQVSVYSNHKDCYTPKTANKIFSRFNSSIIDYATNDAAVKLKVLEDMNL